MKDIKFVLYVICVLFLITGSVIITFIFSVRNIIGSWWSSDPNIQKEISESLIFIYLYLTGIIFITINLH